MKKFFRSQKDKYQGFPPAVVKRVIKNLKSAPYDPDLMGPKRDRFGFAIDDQREDDFWLELALKLIKEDLASDQVRYKYVFSEEDVAEERAAKLCSAYEAVSLKEKAIALRRNAKTITRSDGRKVKCHPAIDPVRDGPRWIDKRTGIPIDRDTGFFPFSTPQDRRYYELLQTMHYPDEEAKGSGRGVAYSVDEGRLVTGEELLRDWAHEQGVEDMPQRDLDVMIARQGGMEEIMRNRFKNYAKYLAKETAVTIALGTCKVAVGGIKVAWRLFDKASQEVDRAFGWGEYTEKSK